MTFCLLSMENSYPEGHPLPSDIQAALPAIIAFERDRCAPARTTELSATLTKVLALVGGPMQQDERREWMLAAADVLREFPGDLVIESLGKARRTCRFASEVVPFVIDDMGRWPEKRLARVTALERLAAVAGIPA